MQVSPEIPVLQCIKISKHIHFGVYLLNLYTAWFPASADGYPIASVYFYTKHLHFATEHFILINEHN